MNIIRELKFKLAGILIKDVSSVAIPEPMITDRDVLFIKNILKDGDAIFSRRNYEFSNAIEKLIIDSFWGHVGIYLDGFIYEAVTKDGFRKISLSRFLYTKDAIGIGRLQGSDWTLDQLASMKKRSDSMLGYQYDFSMNWLSDRMLYCSEAVVKIWISGEAKEAEAIKASKIMGEKQITPQNIWDSVVQVQQFGYGVKK